MSSQAVAKPSVETTVLHDGLLTYGAPHMPSGRCGTLGETPYNARPEGHIGGQASQSGYAVPNVVPDTGSRRENNTSRTSQTLPAQQLVTANQVASGQLSCSPCVPHASARVESERDVERNCVLGDMFQGYQTRGPNGVHMLGQYPAGGGAGSAPGRGKTLRSWTHLPLLRGMMFTVGACTVRVIGHFGNCHRFLRLMRKLLPCRLGTGWKASGP